MILCPPALLAAVLSIAGAGEAAPPPVPPEREDANLHAVHAAGARAWACGDRGVIWRSGDAGRSWSFCRTPTGLSLRSLSFLTNRIGWAAGGGTESFTGDSVGVVLKTTDGGANWERVDATPLPAVVAVRFFTPEAGVAVCEPTDFAPAGLWGTEDGGRVWTPRPGPRLGYWRAAALIGPERAVLVGERGRVALLSGAEPVASPTAPGGLPALTAIAAAGPTAFACGEGGRVWQVGAAGRAWRPLPGPLPADQTNDLDLRGIWAKGNEVAVCGNPGGAVFVLAPNQKGRPTWTVSHTGQTAPLNALAFSAIRSPNGGDDEPYGLAVGNFGAVIRTAAAPSNAAAVGWNAVRAGGRRAAALAIAESPAAVPYLALAATAADDGHRFVALCPVRRDVGPAAVRRPGQADRLDRAVGAAGGSAGLLGWNFPASLPGAEEDAALLLRDWEERFEGTSPNGGDATDLLARRLARSIRTWRPTALVLPAADAAAAPGGPATLLRDAAEKAVVLAADPTRLTELDRLGLRPWVVSRVLERRPADEPAAITVRAADPLGTLGIPAGDLAASAFSRISDAPAPALEGFRPVSLPGSTHAPTGGNRLFAGVHLAPGGPARRPARPRAGEPDASVALRRRLLSAAADRIAAGAASHLLRPEALSANLRPLTAGVPGSRAAADLARLARRLLQASELDAAEAVLIELADRYPAQPAAHAVLPELMRLWCGTERASRRLAPLGVTTRTTDRETGIVNGTVRQAAARVEAADVNVDRGDVGQREATHRHRLNGVLRLGALLERAAPRRFVTREVQRSLAAARRQLGLPTPPGSPATAVLADDGSLAVLPCGVAPAVPRLDGVLSDVCWRGAEAVPLADPAGRSRGGLVMTARNDRFLFLAASLPVDDRCPLPAVNMSNRGHDEPVRPFDRLELALDVDRDFGTAWNLTIAADGAVAEDCCGDASWNPRAAIHVSRQTGATAGDAGAWRIELAIPLTELAPEPPVNGAAWALRLRRVTPGVGAAVWPPPADAVAVTDDAERPFGKLLWTR